MFFDRLLDAGAEVDTSRRMGLAAFMLAAAKKGNDKTDALLLAVGADVSLQDGRGRSAIDWAMASRSQRNYCRYPGWRLNE